MTPNPRARNVVLVAVLGALLAVVVALRTGVHLHPGNARLAWFVAGALVTALLGVFLHATTPGGRLLDFLLNTQRGRLLVLLLGVLAIASFRGVVDVRQAPELVSVLLGASVGSLARLVVVDGD